MALIPKRRRIAVVELFGTIGGRVRSPEYERILTRVRENRRFGALVLDIDSPGGSVMASDYLYRQVARIAEEKPVVASVRGTGASGSYYIACAASKIVASHGAIIGSIGVLSVTPILEELLSRLGVGINVRKSGAYKDMGAFWRQPTPDETEKLQAIIDESYETFVSVVSKARGLDESTVRGLATGEVFWAPTALQNGLIDEVGDLDRAVDMAAELSGAPAKPAFLRPARSFRERILGPFAETLVDAVATEIERRMMTSSLRY